MAMGTAFGQEPVPDPNAEGFDVVKYVDDYIKEHWVAPDPQGEFETTGQWKRRVYERYDDLMNEALKKLYGTPLEEKIDIKLGRYIMIEVEHRCDGYFPITTNGFGTYAFLVEKSWGPWWREQWNKNEFHIRYRYALVDGEPRLVFFQAENTELTNRYDDIYPIDEKTGNIYKFVWKDGVWGKELYLRTKPTY